MSKYPPLIVVMVFGIICFTLGGIVVRIGLEFSPPEPGSEVASTEAPVHSFSSPSSEAGQEQVVPALAFTMNVSAYCPCEKTLDKYTVMWYNAKNGIFERIGNGQEVQEMWQRVDWKSGKMVFFSMCEAVLDGPKPATVHLFVRKLQETLRQTETNQCQGRSASVLFSVVCQSSRGFGKNQDSDTTSTGRVHLDLDARSPQRLRWASNGTPIGNGETYRQAAKAIRMGASQKSYHGRQSNRKPFAGKIQESSPRTRRDTISNPAVYKKKGIAGGTDELRKREVLQPIPEGKRFRVTAYCICEKCCSLKFADGITASGKPAVGKICAAPSVYPFGTVFEVEGYGEWVCEDRGGAIKGDRLDLLFPTHAEALEFGRKDLKVRIVE